MPEVEMTDQELDNVIKTYEQGVNHRFGACCTLAATGIGIAVLLGSVLAPPAAYIAAAGGFIIACMGAIPGGRNMILRDRAHDARSTLQQRREAAG